MKHLSLLLRKPILGFMTLFLISACSYKDTEIEVGSLFDPTFDFSKKSILSFDQNHVEIKNGKAQLKPLDLKHESSDFNNGSHTGALLSSGGTVGLVDPRNVVKSPGEILPSFANNLIGHWSLENNLLDQSQGGNNAFSVGGEVYGEGLVGIKSLSLDGTNRYASIPASANTNLVGAVTMTAWIKTAGTNDFSGIFGKMTTMVPRDGYWMNVNQFSRMRCDIADVTNGQSIQAITTTSVEDGEWHFVACTYNGSFVSAYANGVRESHVAYSGDIGVTADPLQIGVDSTNFATRLFNGSIDEVTLWNVGLGESEIFQIYEEQKKNFTELSSAWTPRWGDVVGYWKMDGNWQDSSANSNQGIANNAVTFDRVNTAVGDQGGIFDGADDYVNLADSTQLAVNHVTVSVWAKTSNLTKINQMIGGYGNTGFLGYIMFYGYSGGRGYFYGRVGTGGVSNFFASQPLLNPLGWNHLVITHDGIDQKLYVNGVLEYTGSVVTGNMDYTGLTDGFVIGNVQGFNPARYFEGSIDDFAVWSEALGASDISLIYNRQKQKYAGYYDSEVIDLGSANSLWSDLNWITSLPFGKELVAGEKLADYSLVIENLNDELVGLWHLNEASWNQAAGEVKDSSGQGNNGISSVGDSINSNCYLGGCGSFESTNTSGVVINTGGDLVIDPNDDFSFSLWIKPDMSFDHPVTGHTIPFYIATDAGYNVALWVMDAADVSKGQLRFYRYNGSVVSIASSSVGAITGDSFQHIVGVKSGSNISLYIDGVHIHTGADILLPGHTTNLLEFGRNDYTGLIDEVAIWSKALSLQEIQQLYRRGANRVKFQVKSCRDANCECKSLNTFPIGSATDCDGDAVVNALDFDDIHKAEFMGPGGDGSTYYSELFNRKGTDLTFNCGLNSSDANSNICVNDEITFGLGPISVSPSIDYSDFPLEARPNANPYFQYRVYLEADSNTACDGSPCFPELTSVNLNPEGSDKFYGSLQEIVPNKSISYKKINALSVTADECVTYQLSPNNSDYYYWSVNSWVLAINPEHRSSKNDLENNIVSFATQFGPGSLYIKSFLETNTSQTQNCSIQSIDISYSEK